MFSAIGSRLRLSPAGVIAVIALVFALSGGAFAADHYLASASKSKAKKGPRGPRGKTGPAGPVGPVGPQGPKGDAGAAGGSGLDGAPGEKGSTGNTGSPGAPGKSVIPETESTGTLNCAGLGGSSFHQEGSATKTFACNGKEGLQGEEGEVGSPWTAGGTLPSEETETGAWTVGPVPKGAEAKESTFEEPLLASISFPIPLSPTATSVEPHYLPIGVTEPACTGSAENPTAEKGHLCVYGAVEHSIAFPAVGAAGKEGVFASSAGAIVQILVWGEGSFAYGTWAVTAP